MEHILEYDEFHSKNSKINEASSPTILETGAEIKAAAATVIPDRKSVV